MEQLDIVDLCDKYEEYIISLRRDFHKYAESGWVEFRTTAKIAEILDDNGIEIHLGKDAINKDFVMGYPDKDTIKNNIERAIKQGAKEQYIDEMEGYTGLLAIIDTKKEGPTIALRFDIDSNDLEECKDVSHRPYREGFSSVNEKFQHSCGHDGHASIGVVIALILNEIKDKLKGKIKIFFQPAEEGVRGARAMTMTNNFDDVDYLLTGHIGFGSTEKNILITNTQGFLATTKIDAYFKGKAAHAGACPEQGRNALLAASCAAINIHAQCQDGRGKSRVNVGYLEAGTGRNVVPDSAVMKIETRGESTVINKTMYEKAINVLKSAAEMYDVEIKTKVVGSANGCNGDCDLAEIIKKASEETGIMKAIKDSYNMNGSEDVTYMMGKVQEHGGKACYMIFGTPIAAPHHSSKFDFDESVLLNATKTVLSTLNYILSNETFKSLSIKNKNKKHMAV
jgi:aminobenzoyl-glutamate utilization protein A